MTFAEYRRWGCEGSLRQHCEDTFAKLSPQAQSAFESVLAELVTLSADDQEAYVSDTLFHWTGLAPLGKGELVDGLVAARLLTTRRIQVASVVSA